jgi:hypothetical protein
MLDVLATTLLGQHARQATAVGAEGESEDLGVLLAAKPTRNPVSFLRLQNQIGGQRIDSFV